MESCRKAAAHKLLNEMIGNIRDTTGGGWKVVILDELTTRIVSSFVKMSDMTDCNVSVVENIAKARQPLPMAAVYFIHPSAASVDSLVRDFSGKPLYPSAHVYFSSKVHPTLLGKIKGCAPLMSAIKTLKESNLEFWAVDSRTFHTDHEAAPMILLGDQAEVAVRECEQQLDSMALRLSTVLATLKEYPSIRYRKPRAVEQGEPPGASARAGLPHRFAAKLMATMDELQHTGAVPNRETCDVLILDRSYDAVVPFIHDWTYEPLVYDLLHVEGNTYKYTAEGASGRAEQREAILEESDKLWVDLRHTFIAEVYTDLGNQFKEFQSKNKAAAKFQGGGRGAASDMSSAQIRALITALPQYRDLLNKLNLHIQMSTEIRDVTKQHDLTTLGEIEQDIVLGEKTGKDMQQWLLEHGSKISVADRVRLLCCYVATHAEKVDVEKLQEWAKIAKLSQRDMVTITNLSLLGVPVMKRGAGGRGGRFFGGDKKTVPDLTRHKKVTANGEGTYALDRFEPLLKDILSDLVSGKLSKEEFPHIKAPAPEAAAADATQSVRTGRGGLNWARRPGTAAAAGGDGSGSGGARRLIVFVIGGAFRSEMRVAHEVAKFSGRDVVLGSTSIETPLTFLDHLMRMNSSGTIYGA